MGKQLHQSHAENSFQRTFDRWRNILRIVVFFKKIDIIFVFVSCVCKMTQRNRSSAARVSEYRIPALSRVQTKIASEFLENRVENVKRRIHAVCLTSVNNVVQTEWKTLRRRRNIKTNNSIDPMQWLLTVFVGARAASMTNWKTKKQYLSGKTTESTKFR